MSRSACIHAQIRSLLTQNYRFGRPANNRRLRPASVAAARRRACPAGAPYGYREVADPSSLDFSTRGSIRLDIEDRRDQVDALADLERSLSAPHKEPARTPL